jgi:hypothetical protein
MHRRSSVRNRLECSHGLPLRFAGCSPSSPGAAIWAESFTGWRARQQIPCLPARPSRSPSEATLEAGGAGCLPRGAAHARGRSRRSGFRLPTRTQPHALHAHVEPLSCVKQQVRTRARVQHWDRTNLTVLRQHARTCREPSGPAQVTSLDEQNSNGSRSHVHLTGAALLRSVAHARVPLGRRELHEQERTRWRSVPRICAGRARVQRRQ